MGIRPSKHGTLCLPARLACAKCVGDRYLKAVIDQGAAGECSYCHRISETATLVDLAEYIRRVFKNHYIRVEKDPKNLKIPFISDTKSNVVLNSEGSSVEAIIRLETGASKKLASDLQRVMEQTFFGGKRRRSQKTENPFDEHARYIHKYADTVVTDDLWDELRRYINREDSVKAKHLLDSIFCDMSKIFESPSVVVEKNPIDGPYKIFRARFFQSEEQLYEALIRLDRELGAPPPERVEIGGRLNAKQTSVFYGAEKEDIAIAEVRPPVGSDVLVACFNTIERIRLLDVSALKSLFEQKSVFDPEYKPLSEKERFLSTLSDRISEPVMPSDEPLDYRITQEISKYLSELDSLNIDGIIYLSTQTEKCMKNVVLFEKSSRVKDRCVKENKDIVQHIRQEGTNTSIRYKIYEKVLSTHIENSDNCDDNRIPKLELDTSNLSLYTITGIQINKSPVDIDVICVSTKNETSQED